MQRLQSKQEESTEAEEMKQQQRMAIMEDLIRKIRSKERMDAQSRWRVAEILAAACEKAWTYEGWEDVMQKWYEWLEYVKKKDEKNVEEMHRQNAGAIDQECRSAGYLNRITKPTMEGRSIDLGKGRRGCEVI